MNKLKLIFAGLVILGLVLFIGGIAISMKEVMEIGLSVGIIGIMGYAVMFIMGSTLRKGRKPIID